MSDLESFKRFLTARGAEVLSPTNPYERVRFRANDEVSVMYEGRRGYSFVGEAEIAWNAFHGRGKRDWNANIRKPRRHMTPVVRTLLDRDGDACFYCKEPMIDGQMSVEHLLALGHGGSDHLSNLVLAHPTCNAKVGHLSIMDKIKIRELR